MWLNGQTQLTRAYVLLHELVEVAALGFLALRVLRRPLHEAPGRVLVEDAPHGKGRRESSSTPESALKRSAPLAAFNENRSLSMGSSITTASPEIVKR